MGLKTEDIDNRRKRLLEGISVISCGYLIKVKAGLIYDGASIPKLFWNLIGSPFTGKYRVASLVHDALYASEGLDRKKCDEVFLDLMEQDGVGYFKRYAMYWAVRLGGGLVWKRHTDESVMESKGYIDVEEI